jgi:DNA-binding transcriptional MerR regulator
MQTRLEAQNLQIQEIGVVAARHSQASHEAGEKAELLSRRLEELSNSHEDAIKRLERAEEELASARARQEDAEKKLRGSERCFDPEFLKVDCPNLV